MKYILFLSSILLINIFSTQTIVAEQIDELTIYQVMQRVIDRHPALKISAFEVEQAGEEKYTIESNLGWVLNSATGIKHDVTAFNVPFDRLELNASIDRKLKSGSTLSLSGGYSYEDSSLAFSPVLPNPVHSTKLDLSYRIPLSQGEGNPAYTEGLVSAEATHQLAIARLLQTRISLAESVKDLFYSAAITSASMENAAQAVQRTRELETYIIKNYKLGLSEEQDKLQVRAQLQSKLTELSAIKLQWLQLQTALNRLMQVRWDQAIYPKLNNDETVIDYDLQTMINAAEIYHPAVVIGQANLKIAESQINIALNTQKDNLDLVMSVGVRSFMGKNVIGHVNEDDGAGSVRLEYKRLLDETGVNSKYKQAQLQRNIALEEINRINDDIRYTVAGNIAEINAARLAVDRSFQQLNSEFLKLKEAGQRFRNGRANTAQLIQFQNEYSFAQLNYRKQKIELNNRIVGLQIFTGDFWARLETGLIPVKGAKK